MKALKDRSGSEHGIYQAYKLALYRPSSDSLPKISSVNCQRVEQEPFGWKAIAGYHWISLYLRGNEKLSSTMIGFK